MVVARWASHTHYGHPTNETAITPPDNASAAAAISRDAMRRWRRPGLSSVHAHAHASRAARSPGLSCGMAAERLGGVFHMFLLLRRQRRSLGRAPSQASD